MHGLNDSLFNVIFSYTRKQAIEDGNLIDVTEQAKETGFKVPVAMSLNLYENYITPSTGLEGEGQSVSWEHGRASTHPSLQCAIGVCRINLDEQTDKPDQSRIRAVSVFIDWDEDSGL